MANLMYGVELAIIGMCTVFVVLLLVIWLGNVLIGAVNKYAPEEIIVQKKVSAASVQGVPDNVMKVISATVSQITGGKGKVSRVEKVQ